MSAPPLAVRRGARPGGRNGPDGRDELAVWPGSTAVGRRAAGPPVPATVVGRHCEAGDVLAEEAALPSDVRAGDLLAVPVAGAYHLSMASAYNLVGRPPVVAVRDGHARTLVRRETLADFRRRDVG
ncbi:hypothetical protein GCM10009801_48560 [Streptomyces albiaxialis]|uniref:Orn/DAP/Arg decarboxylase 2 C-terminal domain-containing protein n=1 Tax=Streptomyces albiaxialis TaxID=329523 RepID=A0ABN2W938_9ACTN